MTRCQIALDTKQQQQQCTHKMWSFSHLEECCRGCTAFRVSCQVLLAGHFCRKPRQGQHGAGAGTGAGAVPVSVLLIPSSQRPVTVAEEHHTTTQDTLTYLCKVPLRDVVNFNSRVVASEKRENTGLCKSQGGCWSGLFYNVTDNMCRFGLQVSAYYGR